MRRVARVLWALHVILQEVGCFRNEEESSHVLLLLSERDLQCASRARGQCLSLWQKGFL